MNKEENNTNDNTIDKIILNKLKEAEEEMKIVTKRYTIDEVLRSMNDIICEKSI